MVCMSNVDENRKRLTGLIESGSRVLCVGQSADEIAEALRHAGCHVVAARTMAHAGGGERYDHAVVDISSGDMDIAALKSAIKAGSGRLFVLGMADGVYEIAPASKRAASSDGADAKALHDRIRLLENLVKVKEESLQRIFRSKGWRLLKVGYDIKEKLRGSSALAPLKGLVKSMRPANIRTLAAIVAKHGPRVLPIMLRERLSRYPGSYIDTFSYLRFISKYESGVSPSGDELSIKPLISVVVPVYNTPRMLLDEMVGSVRAQGYANWELCIASGGDSPETLKALDKLAAADQRIKVKQLDRNKGIAGNTNEAASMCSGEFIALLDHDDTLAPSALYEVARAINEAPEADFIYTDEDKLSNDGRLRMQPHFKPDFSPDLLRSVNYITHLSVFRRSLYEAIGGFNEMLDGSQDYDLILRATEKARRVVHIPKVLYHWRMAEQSTARSGAAKTYTTDSAKVAIAEHMARIGMKDFTVADANISGNYRVARSTTPDAKVTVLIPNKDNADILRRCVEGIHTRSTYKNIEVLIVENNSKDPATFDEYKRLEAEFGVRVVRWEHEFNYSAINNFGVRHATGDVVLLLNNDTEPINPDWIERMLEHALRPEVGAVGAKLYYPDNTLQHAGVILGIGGIAGHSHKYFQRASYGYINRLNLIQDLSAVTGACLMMRRDVYEKIGGFDEQLPVAFNDVDLCMKIRRAGYMIVWTPYAELYHFESKSRGYEDNAEKQARFLREVGYFEGKWGAELKAGDPYYSPNLTLLREDFSVRD